MMQRIEWNGDAYIVGRPPQDVEPARLEAEVRAAADAARSSSGEAPQALIWDARIEGALGQAVALVSFGEAGLDDLLLSQIDASACCAVLESAMKVIEGRGAVGGVQQTGAALAFLSRDPRFKPARVSGLRGTIVDDGDDTGARRIRSAAVPDRLSVVLMVRGEVDSLESALESLADQTISSRADITVVANGLSKAQTRALGETVDRAASVETRRRIRQFVLGGAMTPGMQANTALALVGGDAVVIADPRCLPDGPFVVQTLANWVSGGDVTTASPRIQDGSAGLIAAGLTAGRAQDGGIDVSVWSADALSMTVRRCAGPAPWFFAVNRQAWLDHGGVGGAARPLWTADLCEDRPGSRGKHLLIGSQSAIWMGGRAPADLQARAGVKSLSVDCARALRLDQVLEGETAKSPGRIMGVKAPPTAPAALPVETAFSDAFPNSAHRRILVFADGMGASQSLAFVDGLAASRGRGETAVRLIAESAFGSDGWNPDSRRIADSVERQFSETEPTVVVLSRFGHGAAYAAIRQAAMSRQTPMVFHIDDDLFQLPVVLGAERYRLARHPRRIHTLHRAMEDADLVLAATPVLMRSLANLCGHGRLTHMGAGTAGAPSVARPPKAADQPVIVGYMGSASHNADLEMIVPALNNLLQTYDHVRVELFGSIAEQPAAEQLRGRIGKHKGVFGDYRAFKDKLASLDWDIGLAPLHLNPYNRGKTPTKWVEYAEAGAAVVASDIEVYRPMFDADAALAAGPLQWEHVIGRLIESASLRHELTRAASRLISAEFGWDRLERDVLAAIDRVSPRVLAA